MQNKSYIKGAINVIIKKQINKTLCSLLVLKTADLIPFS